MLNRLNKGNWAMDDGPTLWFVNLYTLHALKGKIVMGLLAGERNEEVCIP